MPQLELLREPAIETLNEVFTYVDSLSNSILKKVFYRFPTILDAISDISSQVLTEQKNKTKVVVENLIDAELGYIFTNDQDYLTMNASIIPVFFIFLYRFSKRIKKIKKMQLLLQQVIMLEVLIIQQLQLKVNLLNKEIKRILIQKRF